MYSIRVFVHITYCNFISSIKINISLFYYLPILLLIKMTVCLRSDDRIFLVGNIESRIHGAKLPSKRQVFQVLFFNIRRVNLSVREAANLTIRECIIFWI